MRENWKDLKLCENTPPCGRRVSTQFFVFPISTRVDITISTRKMFYICVTLSVVHKVHCSVHKNHTSTRTKFYLLAGVDMQSY